MISFISQSMLGMFLRCPAQFEWRYIKEIIIPPGVAARRGSATHKAAQINHEQKRTTKKDLPVADLQDAARDHYIHLVKDEGIFIPKDQIAEKGKLISGGLDAAVRLTKLYRESLAPNIQPKLVEERIEVDVGLDLPLAGTIDVLTEDNWLVDIKTSGKKRNQKDADTSLQLTFYAGMACQCTGKWPEKTSLDVLVDNKTPIYQQLITNRGAKDWSSLLGRIQIFIAQTKTGLFPPCSPDSWVCSQEFCGYWWTCRWGAKR